MQPHIQRARLEGRRILMISDVHGHAQGLRSLLEQADFGPQDVLVIVGDLVEKGPESLAAVRLVMDLQKRCTVYALMGNVDWWRLQRLTSQDPALQKELADYSRKALRWWGSSFLEELLQEIGLSLNGLTDPAGAFERLQTHFSAELSFLSALPAVLETEEMIFVHGGIPHERLDELTEMTPLLKRDRFWSEGLCFSKYVAVGHWPVSLYPDHGLCSNPIIDRERRIICLDGGCGLQIDGQLNLLAFRAPEDFALFTWNGCPQAIALDAQEEAAASVCIRYGRELQQVEVLKQLEGCVRARYQNHELLIPEAFLAWQDGQCFCDGFTDYRPMVRKGDRLSVLLRHGGAAYVKKDGVTGWYAGRLKTIP